MEASLVEARRPWQAEGHVLFQKGFFLCPSLLCCLEAEPIISAQPCLPSWGELVRVYRMQLEGTFSSHVVQLPDSLRAKQKVKHGIECIMQMLLEH